MRRMPPDLIELGSTIDVSPRRDAGRVSQTRSYRLITPLLGGGVEPKEADPVKVVSEKGVRGQLRFWWRAARGTGSLAEMKAREDALWGNASRPGLPLDSKVSVVVKVTRRGDHDQPFEGQGGRPERARGGTSAHPYAAFTLQRTDEERREDPDGPSRAVLLGVEFEMRITFPAASRAEVEAALWCWEVFGGVGGRTRRGFGALSLTRLVEHDEEDKILDFPRPTVSTAESYIRDGLASARADGVWPAGVPHLPAALAGLLSVKAGRYAGRSRVTDSALNSWWYLIDRLQRFRQSPRSETQFHGRSHWPEPDAVRRLTGHNAPHRGPEHPVENKFPRAAFGLPIIFKFKQDDERAGDPWKSTLEGAYHNRLASPLVLRPLACADGAVGVALVLDAPREPPGGVYLRGAQLRGGKNIRTELTGEEASTITPLRNPPPVEADVLKAFLKTL